MEQPLINHNNDDDDDNDNLSYSIASVLPSTKINQTQSNTGNLTISNSSEEIPSHILAVQTDRFFSSSDYNNLAFAHYYREEDKQNPHIWFPQVTEALRKSLNDSLHLEHLHIELSLLLSALASFKNLIPLNNYS